MPVKSDLLLIPAAIAAVFALKLFLKWVEPKLIFFPPKGIVTTPAQLGMEFQDVWIDSGGHKIHGWYLPGDPKKRHILFFHGNANNLEGMIGFIRFMAPERYNFLFIDYRGYGKSEGTPSITGLGEDAAASAKWLREVKGVPADETVFWGHSLGAAAASIAVGAYPDTAGLIMESAFVSLRKIGKDIYPIFPSFFITDGLDNGAIVSELEIPKLFIHGVHDETTPYHHGEQLHNMAKTPKRLYSLSNSGHNDTFDSAGEQYRKIVSEWINSL